MPQCCGLQQQGVHEDHLFGLLQGIFDVEGRIRMLSRMSKCAKDIFLELQLAVSSFDVYCVVVSCDERGKSEVFNQTVELSFSLIKEIYS